LDATKDVVNDTLERRGGVDFASLSKSLLRVVQAQDDVAFLLPSAPVARVGEYALIDPSHHRGKVVDFENEHPVEEVDELRRIAAAAAKERHRLFLVGEQGLHLRYIPAGREVRCGCTAFTCFRLAPEFSVAVDGLITPPLQFVADRSFAGAGTTVDQVVSDAHW
jgi:hypothetical protein